MRVLSSYALFTATSYRCGSFFLIYAKYWKKEKECDRMFQ